MIEELTQESLLATPVAPEDIRAGDYLAPMNELLQYAVRGCESDWSSGGEKPPRLHLVSVRAIESFPSVMRVLAVGLPFVLVEDSCGTTSLQTCRLTQFARLPEAMGRRALREADRRTREEARKRRRRREERRDKQDRPGAGSEGSD